jgi:glycosyltransferase involved in cell wall biosynthesis
MFDLDTPRPPVSLALAVTGLAPGGAESCLAELACGLDRKRFSVRVISLRPRPAGAKARLVDRLEAAGIDVRFLNITASWQVLAAVWRMRRALREQPTDILHSFLYHANALGALATRWASVRRVVAGIRVADPSGWRQGVQKYFDRQVDRYVCVSDEVAEHARREGGLWPGKLTVIPNGVDVARHSAVPPLDMAALGVPRGRPALVCVGRLAHQKGFDWLLELTPRLFAQLPRHDLVVVGEGPQRAFLERRAKALGVAERIHFAGWRPDVPAILRGAALLVLPSRWEGMPNVVLEAMACGRPVVATAVEGVREVLGRLSSIQSVTPNDHEAFITRILQIARDDQLAASLGEENRRHVAEHYSLARMIAAHATLYESLLEQ